MNKTIDQTRGIYRRIYASFLTGRRINAVSLEAEAWFWRLQALADDFGSFPADPRVLASQAAPRRKVSPAKCEKYVTELAGAGLIHLYTVDEFRFGEIDGFGSFQRAPGNGRRIRKYPAREDDVESGGIRVNPGESGCSPGESVVPHAQAQAQAQAQAHPQAQPLPQGGTSEAGGGGGASLGIGGEDWRKKAEARMTNVIGVSRGKARELAHHPLLTPEDLAETWKAVVNDPKVKSRVGVFVRRMQDLLGISK